MTIANTGAADYWNGGGGEGWVAKEQQYESQLAPFIAPLLAAADLSPGLRVVDIGCGFGPTTEAAAAAVAPGGSITGLDISSPLLELARARSAHLGDDVVAPRYELGDAQVADLPDLAGGPVDRVISRFGVMFFEDPEAAFSNIGSGLSGGGHLVTVVWQPLQQNPWMLVGAQAICAGHGVEVAHPGDSPGPFALGDADRTEALLGRAGFGSVSLEAFVTPLQVGGGANAAAAAHHAVDSMSMFLPGNVEPAPREDRVAMVAAALAPHEGPDGVVLDGATWVVTARP